MRLESDFGMQVCVETMMHLTCTNINKEQLADALNQVAFASQMLLELVTAKSLSDNGTPGLPRL